MKIATLSTLLLLLAIESPAQTSNQAMPTASPVTAAPLKIPAFDVVSVKSSNPAASRGYSRIEFTPDGLHIENASLQELLRNTFSLEDDRILGAPAWVKSSNYDIDAKFDPADIPTFKAIPLDQRKKILQPLLEDRFKLKTHRDTKELPAYALVLAKGGSKLTLSGPDTPGIPTRHMILMKGSGDLEAQGIGLDVMLHVFSQQLGRTIVDKTGLTGIFNFSLKWTPDDIPCTGPYCASAPIASGQSTDSGPSIFAAVQEQLGLKLEAQKIPIEILVIDHIEQPSQN